LIVAIQVGPFAIDPLESVAVPPTILTFPLNPPLEKGDYK
jgi:hypothetical protein